MPPTLRTNLRLTGLSWRRSLAAAIIGIAFTCEAVAFDSTALRTASRAYGAHVEQSVIELQELLTAIAGATDGTKLVAVNRFVNRHLLFRTDLQVWGVADYWASPLESMSKGAGDCEDFAIAKYFELLAAGVQPSRLRMVYVQAIISGMPQPHMVVAYYASAGADPLILDNLVATVTPASARNDLTPVFSFNSEGLWQGERPAGDPVKRISQWGDVVAKARREGFGG